MAKQRNSSQSFFFSLRHEIILFLQENNKELANNGWWSLVAFLCDITDKLCDLKSISYEEIQSQILLNFPTLTKAKEDGITISSDTYTIISVIYLPY